MATRKIRRYRPGQCYVHLLGATSFTVLFLTGLPLIWSPLSFLAEGGWRRIIHRVAAVAFMSVPVLNFVVDRQGAKELIRDSFTFDRDEVRWLMHMGRCFLGAAADMPPEGRLTAGQKLHHVAVMPLSAGVVFSAMQVKGAVVIDVRNPEDYEDGHIPGAINIPIRELGDDLNHIPTDSPVWIFCQTAGGPA